MAHQIEGGSASERSNGSEAEQSGRVPVAVERLALQVERAGHCLAAGNDHSAARQLRRFWADYLAVVGPDGQNADGRSGSTEGSDATTDGTNTTTGGPGATTSASATAPSDLATRARRAHEAGVVDDDLADALVTFAGRDAGVDATARLLDLTTSHLDARLG